MDYLFWVVLAAIGLAFGVTSSLMLLSEVESASALEVMGILLSIVGIAIGVIIASRQIDQGKRLEEYSEKTESLQQAAMSAALLEVYPLLKSNRMILLEQHDIIQTQFLAENEKLRYMAKTFVPNSEISSSIVQRCGEMILLITPFKPIMPGYTRIVGYANRMIKLGNPQPAGLTFTPKVLQDWNVECERLLDEVNSFLSEAK